MMEESGPDYGQWRPLPRILYGFAIFPFSPIEDEAQHNVHQVPLEIGSELYVFEVFRPTTGTPYTDEESLWYRGYVVASRQTANGTVGTDLAGHGAAAGGAVEEPSVTVGIFPATHCLLKERLEITDARLDKIRQSDAATGTEDDFRSPIADNSLRQVKHPLEPLLEYPEDESHEEDVFSGLVDRRSTVSRPRKRTSIVDGRLSATYSHKRSSSSGSNIAPPQSAPQHKQVFDDRPTPPLPSLKTGDETAAGAQEPLIDEIACSLRGSASLLHSYLFRRDYVNFHALKSRVDELHLGRRQLLSGTLSTDELHRLRTNLVNKLVLLNLQQGSDIVVRHPQWGALVDVEAHGDIDEASWMSAIRMYKLSVELAYTNRTTGQRPIGAHSVLGPSTSFPVSSAKLKAATAESAASDGTTFTPSFYHVLLDLKAFFASPCAPGETAELIFSLYNTSEKRFLTEECCIVVNHQGVPRDGRIDRTRVLFKDLSQQDVLDTLVLVCRIVVNGSFRASANTSSRLSAANLNSPYSFGPPASSASFMSPALHSVTSFGEQSDLQTSRKESLLGHPDDFRRTCRRPFGCAVVQISDLCTGVETSNSGSTEMIMPIFVPLHEGNFSTLHEDLLASRIKQFEKSPKAEHISIGLRFLHGDIKSIERDHPSFMHDTPTVSRLGFPDIVLPDDQRNDVYIKIWSGNFPSLAASGSKLGRTSLANVEVEIEVRDRNGAIVHGAVSRGAGEPTIDRFTSVVFRSNPSPTWGELLRLGLAPERLQECHLFITLRNRRERAAPATTASSSQVAPDKPFAFGYLRLFSKQSTFLSDGMHSIVLYRYDEAWTTPSVYLDIPSNDTSSLSSSVANDTNKGPTATRDTLAIRSFLCSTQLTQDPTLLALFSWETETSMTTSVLRDIFNRLKYAPEFECIKLIRKVFDAIFGILASARNEHGELDAPAFSVLVNFLSLVNDRRFESFRPVLDLYINHHFTSSTAHTHLVRSLQNLIDNFSRSESAQDLRSSIKVWPYLFRLIAQSRKLQRAKDEHMNITASHIESTFKKEIGNLLKSINVLMSAAQPASVVGAQSLAVQHFAGIIPEVLDCFSVEVTTEIVIAFCDCAAQKTGTIVVHMLLLLQQIVGSTLFRNSSARALLVPNICRWLKPCLGSINTSEAVRTAGKSQNNVRVTWLENMRFALAVLAILLDQIQEHIVSQEIRSNRYLFAQEQDNIEFLLSLLPRLLESFHDSISEQNTQALLTYRSVVTTDQAEPTLFPAVYPAPLLLARPEPRHQDSSTPSPFVILHGEAAAVIIALIHVSPSTVLDNYLQACIEVEGEDSFSKLLSSLFYTCSTFLQHKAFPPSWLNVSMLAHRSVLRIAEPASLAMQKYLIPDRSKASSFEVAVWRQFFDMMLKLLSSPALVIEDFSAAHQRAVWHLAGDVRGDGSRILLQAWESLSWPQGLHASDTTSYGGFQVSLSNMVEPILELCLSHHDELRNTAVQILYSLVITEFYLNGSFDAIENEILDRLDKLFSLRKGDEISRAFFITQLRSLFESTDTDMDLRNKVDKFLDSINHFLELLLDIRNLPESEEWQDDRVIGTLRLMAFVENRHRKIFIRYVHRLVDFHIASSHYTEAGLTLKLHADLYTFDPANTAQSIVELDFPEQSEFNRKELLFLRILEYLSRGGAYETAIAISKELQQQYEHHVFAYQRLSELLTHQADLFASIVNQARHYAPTFRVGFFGRGFPIAVQNKQFVYRAFEWEKYGSFCERMQSKHPQAHLIRSQDAPSFDMQESENRYLLITPVQPEPDRENPILQNPDVFPALKSYFENNETRTYTYTRRLERVDHSFMEAAEAISHWTETCYLECAEAFPSILRRTEILHTRIVEISPLENALADVRKKTADLAALHRQYSTLLLGNLGNTGPMDTSTLSMALNNAVDTGLDGGIPLYRKAFFSPLYITAHPDNVELFEQLKEAIDANVTTLSDCLLLHHKICPPEMATFDETLVKFFERNFAAEIETLGPKLVYRADYMLPAAARQEDKVTSPNIPNGQTTAATVDIGPHRRTMSSATVTSSTLHLPLALPPVSTSAVPMPLDEKRLVPQGILTREKSQTQASVPSAAPRPQPNGVHFAPAPQVPSSGRISPQSTVASTNGAGTVNSGRPQSFLNRLSSLRKKRF